MIVFGDRSRRRSPAEQVDALCRDLAALGSQGPGVDRHAALVSLLLSAGELVQGLADAAFERDGLDRLDPAAGAAMQVAVAAGQAVWRSHRTGYAELVDLTGATVALDRLRRTALPATITVRAAEGFQHYAVYPETYALAAAAAFGAADPAPLVIGIRTIGATLAAFVAGAVSPASLPLTVRPIGPPFERRLALGDDVAGTLASARGRPVAIADEGPGLSGSSFGAVLDALDAARVPEADVRVFPSHEGDVGGAASAKVRARWKRLGRAHVRFEDAFLDPKGPGLASWARDLIGALDEPPLDIGAGGWRRQLWPDPRDWSPVIAMRERRKFLLRAGGVRFLARFGGLGEAGQSAGRRASLLADGGFSPPLVGVRHGFVLTRWVEGARSLWTSRAAVRRPMLIDHLAAYLAFRAARLPAGADRGAAPAALLEMATLNAREGGCPGAAGRLQRFGSWLPDLARAARPIEVDARLHAWEWLVLPDGRLWKTDAVDHCDAHDPIGCQDLAWDVAGASVELDLDPSEQRAFQRGLAARGQAVEPEPLAFYRGAYLAFQMGLHASGAAIAGDPAEVARLSAAADRYRGLLESE